MKIKVGIIGCGTIGSAIAKACETILKDNFELIGICDADQAKAKALKGRLNKKVRIFKMDDLIRGVDLVVESATAKIVGEVLEKCVGSRKDAFIMSIGGVLGNERLLKMAQARQIRVYLPSGAICGIDGVKAASFGVVDSITLTTRKPPKGLEGAPYLEKNRIDLSKINDETVLFDGSADDAVKGFPQNVNVASILSIAGIGALKTRVRIVTSPKYTKNVHELEVVGDFGRITTKTENVPSKTNPKTSALAILSAIAALDGIAKSVRIGT